MKLENHAHGVFFLSLLFLGNICNERNIREFAKVILEATDGSGVDLVTADGVRIP